MNKFLFWLYFRRLPIDYLDAIYFRFFNRCLLEFYRRGIRFCLNWGLLNLSAEIAENYVVSLTTYKQRIHWVYLPITSILLGTIRPKKIKLYLSEVEFPNKWKDLPRELLELEKLGLEIEFRTKNLKSHKKYCYSFREYSEFKIITIDDDIIYPADFLERVLSINKKLPKLSIVSFLGMNMEMDEHGKFQSYSSWKYIHEVRNDTNTIIMGGYGCLYNSPGELLKFFIEKDAITDFETGDDIYLYYLARKSGMENYVFGDRYKRFFPILPWAQKTNLYEENIGGGKNDIMLKKMQEMLS